MNKSQSDIIKSDLYHQHAILYSMTNAGHLSDDARHALRVAEGLLCALSSAITWQGSISRNDAHSLLQILLDNAQGNPLVEKYLDAARARVPVKG